MSHRVTVQTEITDKALALQALNNAKLHYVDEGDVLRVSKGGGRRDYTINLKTGSIVGDSDFHTKSELGVLRQSYAHAKFMKEAMDSGTQVYQTYTDESGNIVLRCRTA